MYDYEDWRLVPDFENYEVSDLGRVFNNKLERFVGGSKRDNGYTRIVLTQNGYVKDTWLHLLVADLYLEDYVVGMHVRHIDGNKSNNSVGNLMPVGPFRNNGPVYIPDYKGGRLVRIIETDEIFPNVMVLAIALETDASTIYKCLRGERKRHLGFTYEYVD